MIVSYITYKTKARDRVPIQLKNYDPRGNRLAIQTVAANNYKLIRQTASQNVIPIQSNIHSPKSEELQRANDNYLRAVQAMQKKTYKTKIYSETDEEEKNEMIKNRESHQLTRSYQPNPLLNRLEILNLSEKFRTSVQDESHSIKKENRSTNHGDINLFSFYSDRSDQDFVAFSTPRINRAM
jgi:non-homologous end joining protein Ku